MKVRQAIEQLSAMNQEAELTDDDGASLWNLSESSMDVCQFDGSWAYGMPTVVAEFSEEDPSALPGGS